MPGHFLKLIEQCGIDPNAQLPKGGATGDVLTKNSGADFDASFQPSSGGGGALITQKTTLSAIELLALPAAVNLVPSPGAGKIIVVLNFSAVYRAGLNPYVIVNPPDYFIIFPTGSDPVADDSIFFQLEADGFVDQATDLFTQGQLEFEAIQNPSVFEDRGIDVSLSSSGLPGLTGGDGEVDFYVTYFVITL
jgi:hypothetical protein